MQDKTSSTRMPVIQTLESAEYKLREAFQAAEAMGAKLGREIPERGKEPANIRLSVPELAERIHKLATILYDELCFHHDTIGNFDCGTEASAVPPLRSRSAVQLG